MNNDPNWHNNNDGPSKEDRFADGFQEGFSRAREIFWRDFMRKAGDARLMAQIIADSPGDNSTQSENFALMVTVYRSVADAIAKSHTLYPGAVHVDLDLENPTGSQNTTVRFDGLFKY